MNEEREQALKELCATLTHYCQAAASYRREAQEIMSEAKWYEAEAEAIRKEIAILEAE